MTFGERIVKIVGTEGIEKWIGRDLFAEREMLALTWKKHANPSTTITPRV